MSSGRIGPGERLKMAAPHDPPPPPPNNPPLGLIGTGAIHVLDRRTEWDNPVDAPNFKTRFVPGTRTVQLGWRDPPEAEQMAEKSLEKTRRALDFVSVGGGGHFRIPHPWRNRLLWRSSEEGIHLHASSVFLLETPMTMMREHRDVPEDAKKPIGKERYNDAFRYFRLAQVAPDPFYAFRNMWLAFENLLSQVSPHDDRGAQRWIRETLQECAERYDPSIRDELLEDEHLEEFVEEVYTARNLVFHSKDGRGRYVPATSRDERRVEEALERLTRHVLELVRIDTGWPLNARPLMDVELSGDGGELLGDTVQIGLYQYTGENEMKTSQFKLDPTDAELTKRYAMLTEEVDEDPKGIERIDGMFVAFDDPYPNTWSRFEIPVSVGNVTSLTLTAAIRPRLTQAIRTVWTTEEEPLPRADR